MSSETFNYLLRRVFCTPPCSNDELDHAINTYEDAVSRINCESSFSDATPVYDRYQHLKKYGEAYPPRIFFWFHLLLICTCINNFVKNKILYKLNGLLSL